jgi:NAD(P)-dependent dehydrogenase (short-subunit alcohol dehydrogenase family)
MLKDKVIVVIGGAGLLGFEFVKTIINNHGVVIISDNNEESGEKVLFELKRDFIDSKVDFIKIDIIDKRSIELLIKTIVNKYSKIDAVLNTSYPKNKNYGRKFEDIEYEDFCEMINLHIGGYFLVCQKFVEYFKKQGYGNIINMASIYGVIAPRFEIYDETKMTMPIEYTAIKSAIISMTRYIAKYLKEQNIRVNCISPGGIIDKQPEKFLNKYKDHCLSKGMLDKSDISGTLLFLLSDLSKYINGQNIIVDDGFSL